jgi:parallel beta-helix repeat protein
MKHFFTILFLIFMLTFSISFAQVNWIKYSGNPVLGPGPSGEWDSRRLGMPSVLFDGSTYHMWYTADSVGVFLHDIGYATSDDGIIWTKYDDSNTPDPPFAESDPVLSPGTPGSWDDDRVNMPCVILIDTVYHMWYGGADNPDHNAGAIGHATSIDGINWAKNENNPVLDVGPPGSWDDEWVWDPWVLFDGSIYHMWYFAWNGIGELVQIGHATSPHPDSVWTKDPNNPVLSFENGNWDYPRAQAPCVIYDGNTFHMWYSGGQMSEYRIGYATSADGSEWTKFENNPVLEPGSAGSWDETFVGFCSVIDSAGAKYKMWYTGGGSGSFGYATAPHSIIRVPDHYTTIQEGIDAAASGDVVLVDEGTYYENINFKGKAITVASHFWFDGDTSHISKTIIDGSQHQVPDSGSVVYFISGEDTTSVLCGFTITGGSGTYTQQYTFRWGGGIACWYSGARISSNKINNNVIYGNSNTAWGGGIGAGYFGSNAYIIIEKNHITNNETYSTGGFALGGGVGMACNGRLIDNVISHNSCTSTASEANGGGIKIAAESASLPSTVLIKGNYIAHNTATGLKVTPHDGAKGGGIVNHYCKVHILQNEILYNRLNANLDGTARGAGIHFSYAHNESEISQNIINFNTINDSITDNSGGGISFYSCNGVSICNNIISGNSAMDGGGIRIVNIDSEIINNTIVNNTASGSGGGLYTYNSNPRVFNNILWDNQAGNGAGIYPSNLANVRFSDVQGTNVYPGQGNINADPMFADTILYELSDSSKCVGWGTDSVQILGTPYYAPSIDYDGDPRPNPVDNFVDMGAQESAYPKVIIDNLANADLDVPLSFALFQNYPNPFNPTTMINYQLPMTSAVELSIYNLLGQRVATLVDKKQLAGSYTVQWDASGFATGVYYYQLKAGDFIETRKMVLLR